MRRAASAVLWVVLAVVLCATTACSQDESPGTSEDGPQAGGSTSTSVPTLSPMPMPDTGPPPGRLVADLRQSSRDAALGRFEVWVGNGLRLPVQPLRLVYRDGRFQAPIDGERLREIPADSERGFPLPLPPRPRCADPRPGRPVLTVHHGDRVVQLDVEDEADVVERYVATRCFELALDEAVELSFDDRVPLRPGTDQVATLTLRVDPSGVPGHRVRLRTVSGTPVLTPPGRPVWRPRAEVASDAEPLVLELPVAPARCDPHAFAESGGATAFRLRLELDGTRGEIVVRMSQQGASNALNFARDACGLGAD